MNYINLDIKKGEYSKNIICTTNLYSINVITWGPSSETDIHDHPKFGCHIKVLDGTFTEKLYHPKTQVYLNEHKLTNYSFIHNDISKHKIVYNNPYYPGYTLQIYFPGYYNNEFSKK
jgi:hypothetical protein